MKRLLGIALALMLVISLAACGGGDSGAGTDSGADNTSAPASIPATTTPPASTPEPEPEQSLVHHELESGAFVDYDPEIWKLQSFAYGFTGIDNEVTLAFMHRGNASLEDEAQSKIDGQDIISDTQVAIAGFDARKLTYINPMFGSDVYYHIYYIEFDEPVGEYKRMSMIIELSSYQDNLDSDAVMDLLNSYTIE